MEGLHRRRSGVYFARLTVPDRLRSVVGRRELVASTRLRVRADAVVVAAEILTLWRRRLRDLDGQLGGATKLDYLKVVAGSPVLGGSGYLPLADAAKATGATKEELLREAINGRLSLFFRATGIRGAEIDFDAIAVEPDGGRDVSDVHTRGDQCSAIGMLTILHPREVATGLLGPDVWDEVLFRYVERPSMAFVPDQAILLSVSNVELALTEVEAARRAWAAEITPAQLEHAREQTVRLVPDATKKPSRRLSEALTAFMKERSEGCSEEQARRVSSAIALFIELKGDMLLEDVTRDVLRDYRDHTLPNVPARENKVRLQHGTTSVSESMAAVKGQGWPGLSEGERLKRMQWLSGLFSWLTNEKWIADDPAVGLAKRKPEKKGAKIREQDKRKAFTPDELKAIFSRPWFAAGRGKLTKGGKYHGYQPAHYWLPLLGLHTGARPNELCQLLLSDVRPTSDGGWCLDISEDDSEDVGPKSLKNKPSIRVVPVHSRLMALGFATWCERLRAAGYDRVFPELSFTKGKGYAVMFGRWFSTVLAGLGLPRDGAKAFYSFRHCAANTLHNGGHLEVLVNEVLGHQRGKGEGKRRYRKDVGPEALRPIVEALRYDLPEIASFDQDAGMAAILDALGRKNRGRGVGEDG